jgi:hypothetical protein
VFTPSLRKRTHERQSSPNRCHSRGKRFAAPPTGVKQLSDAGLRREHQDYVVERQRTEEVEEKPRLQISNGDKSRLQYDLVNVFVSDDTCGQSGHKLPSMYLEKSEMPNAKSNFHRGKNDAWISSAFVTFKNTMYVYEMI